MSEMSKMIPLGTKAPDFNLFDTASGKQHSLQELKSDIATVIIFMCNHCPYVQHILPELLKITATYQIKGVSFIAVSANDAQQYPEDGPSEMRKQALKYRFNFPYLYDETQTVAKAYQAACTPDIYIFDANLACVYRGAFDDSTPNNNRPVTGCYLANALDALLSKTSVDANQKASIGCSIKWKKKELAFS